MPERDWHEMPSCRRYMCPNNNHHTDCWKNAKSELYCPDCGMAVDD